MWFVRQRDADLVAPRKLAPGRRDRHDAAPSDRFARFVLEDEALHQTRTDSVQLTAGIPEAGQLEDDLRPEREARAGRQRVEIEIPGQHVLAETAREDVEALGRELVEELAGDQVDLPQVRLGGIPGDAGAMLHRLARVDVALEAETADHAHTLRRGLRERVAGAE